MNRASHPRHPLGGRGRYVRQTFLAAIAVIVFHTSTPSAEAAFGFRKQITIDNTKVSGSADLTDFPVLVSLTDLDLRTTANGGKVENANGFDIVFRQGCTTTNLDHEIEKYDPVTGTFVAWVRIPVLSYNTDTLIEMYYGDATIVSSQEDSAGVWDSNYKGVWHLNQDPTFPNPVIDSTTYPNNAVTCPACMDSFDLVAGKIDGAIEFEQAEATNSLQVTDITGLEPPSYTLEAWLRPGGPQVNFAYFIAKLVGGPGLSYSMLLAPPPGL